MNWTNDLKNRAAAQGWTMEAIWDQKKQRIESQIFKADGVDKFTTDEAARGFVAEQVKRGDSLAIAATKAVFQSKLGAHESKHRSYKK
jgi:hypothetical protein